MNNIFEKEWLEKNVFYSLLNENKLKHIFYFPILWNIFEKELCNNIALINKYKEISREITINPSKEKEINSIYNYFKNRYIKERWRFEYLKFRNNKTEQDIKREILERFSKEEIKLLEKIEVILCIAFRIRNNLYHGEKQVDKLYEQNENFAQINKFLILAIEGYKNDN